MDLVKIYVRGKDKAVVTCPSCGKAEVIGLADADLSQNFEIECICGIRIPVIFEKRRSSRKRVLLTGTCFSKNDPPGGTRVKILDLSKGGMRFLKESGENLKLNETVKMRFIAGSSSNVVRCSVQVTNIEGNNIGVKFLNLDLNAQKTIGACVRF
jgi:hypothetical protein